YVGLDPAESFSGLAATVLAELQLAAADASALAAARRLLEALDFGYVLDLNPFCLSGGEQVVAAIVAALALRPARLAIDGALEQLAADTRGALLDQLAKLDGCALIVDNRFAEWGSHD